MKKTATFCQVQKSYQFFYIYKNYINMIVITVRLAYFNGYGYKDMSILRLLQPNYILMGENYYYFRF